MALAEVTASSGADVASAVAGAGVGVGKDSDTAASVVAGVVVTEMAAGVGVKVGTTCAVGVAVGVGVGAALPPQLASNRASNMNGRRQSLQSRRPPTVVCASLACCLALHLVVFDLTVRFISVFNALGLAWVPVRAVCAASRFDSTCRYGIIATSVRK